MKSIAFVVAILVLSTIFYSCKKDETDSEKPVIDLSIPNSFPQNCDTMYFGDPIVVKLGFSDNVELGSYSIDIHHNFDHHSHSTEVSACIMDSVKSPVNPFTFIQDYTIPSGEKNYETGISITFPAGNSTGLFDDGDYHFFVSLTDKEGWSTQKGLSIKMLHH